MNQQADPFSKSQHPRTLAMLASLVAALLGACGGGDNSAGVDDAQGGDFRLSRQQASDQFNMSSGSGTAPMDVASRTKAGLYASSKEAKLLERSLADEVINVDIACCGIEGVELALGVAYGMQAARNLPNSVPVLVRAADLRMGAVVANGLSDAGYSEVWLVTQ